VVVFVVVLVVVVVVVVVVVSAAIDVVNPHVMQMILPKFFG
jgi:hypothetical protein